MWSFEQPPSFLNVVCTRPQLFMKAWFLIIIFLNIAWAVFYARYGDRKKYWTSRFEKIIQYFWKSLGQEKSLETANDTEPKICGKVVTMLQTMFLCPMPINVHVIINDILNLEGQYVYSKKILNFYFVFTACTCNLITLKC